ncbi:MAG TPA: hypothetical protein VH391_01405 [Solirubrobacterales bacterium]
MSPLELSLAAAALLIGLTGAWSPCGFSMVETIGLAGDEGRRWTTVAACATFAPGAILGGVVTFGLLALLGEATHGAGARIAYLIAAGIAVAAAVAEARGARIVPQIRRQLPEGWRWTMPLPLAAGLYGILLGLGFTTFVLSFGVWALAGISVALGDPTAGVVIGATFGVGRAIPVVAVAPLVDRPLGNRCIELMAERPSIYRLFRLGDAVTLGLVAVALTSTASATAARTEVPHGADPSAAGKALAFQRADRAAFLRYGGHTYNLPGRDPAVGGPYVAVISGGDQVNILSRFTRQPLASVETPGAVAVAISREWLAYLAIRHGRYLLRARRITDPAHPGHVKGIASLPSPNQLGHPSIDGSSVFYTVSKRRRNSIKRHNLRSGKEGTVVRSHTVQLLNPSAQRKHLLYMRVSRGSEPPLAIRPRRLHQTLMIKRRGRGGAGHRIYRRGRRGTLWTTALAGRHALVTVLGHGGPRIISTHR